MVIPLEGVGNINGIHQLYCFQFFWVLIFRDKIEMTLYLIIHIYIVFQMENQQHLPFCCSTKCVKKPLCIRHASLDNTSTVSLINSFNSKVEF